jgi:iron complex outermembrane receptor protein
MQHIGHNSGRAIRSLKSRLLRENVVACVMVAGVIAAGPSAYAQSSGAGAAAGSSAGTSAPEQVVVTGSLISNPALTGNAPVAVIGQDEVQFRQSLTAEDFLSEMPGAVAGIGPAVDAGNTGASTVDLRGLGPNRNIVLLDGKRIVPADLTGEVDLNDIPLALIKRTEVLTGGASTTYGADAIAGVVNFITRDDFSGLEFNAGSGITQRGDGATNHIDATFGLNTDDGKGNVVISLGYLRANAVSQGNRSVSSQVLDSFSGQFSGSGTTFPARINVAGAGLGTLQINPTSGALVPTYQLYNYFPDDVFQTPYSRYNLFAEGHYTLNSHITFYARGMFSKN